VRNFEIPFGDLQHVVIVARLALCFVIGFKNQFCAVNETDSCSRKQSAQPMVPCIHGNHLQASSCVDMGAVYDCFATVDRCTTIGEALSPSARGELLSPLCQAIWP
jgi:hypothetical protein